MSIALIPVNEEMKEKIIREIQRKVHINDIDQFITMVNSDIFNMGNPVIEELALKIVECYTNVAITKKRFVVKTADEIAVENSIALLEGWRIIATLKRFSEYLINDGYGLETPIVFSPDKIGVPQFEVVKQLEDGGMSKELLTHWTSEKIQDFKHDVVKKNLCLKTLFHPYDNEDRYFVTIAEITDVYTEFLKEIENIVLRNTFKERV